MNSAHVIYAQKIYEIGTRIQEVSSGLFAKNQIDIEEIKKDRDRCLAAIKAYKECMNDLLKIEPPDEICDKHREMVAATQMFIDGTELMSNALDIDRRLVDWDRWDKGIHLQQQGTEKVVNLANQISQILNGKNS